MFKFLFWFDEVVYLSVVIEYMVSTPEVDSSFHQRIWFSSLHLGECQHGSSSTAAVDSLSCDEELTEVWTENFHILLSYLCNRLDSGLVFEWGVWHLRRCHSACVALWFYFYGGVYPVICVAPEYGILLCWGCQNLWRRIHSLDWWYDHSPGPDVWSSSDQCGCFPGWCHSLHQGHEESRLSVEPR